jgi:hypothetical protein
MPKAGSGYTAVTVTKAVRSDLDKIAILMSARLGKRLTLGQAITEAAKLIEGLPKEH